MTPMTTTASLEHTAAAGDVSAYEPCPVCRSPESAPAPGVEQRWAPRTLLECAQCGLWHTSPKLAPDELDEHYADDYAPFQPRIKRAGLFAGAAERWQSLRLSVARRKSRGDDRPHFFRNDPYMPLPFGGGRLLDVGCGNGNYLAKMKRIGWNVQGLDISPIAAEQVTKQHGVPVVVQSLSDPQPIPGGPFDLIVGRQVLEHVDDPPTALANLRRQLEPGKGKLLLSVPNRESLSAKVFGSDWIGWDIPRHVSHFSGRTLCRLLESQGFEIVDVRTLGQSGWMRHSARGSKTKLSSLLGYKTLSRVFAAWSTFRDAGDSLYVLARRRS